MGRTIGQIFITHPERIVLGVLSYEDKRDNALVGLDLAAVLPVCRSTELSELCCYCVPRIEFDSPPYIQADIQVCLKTKRIKIGWIFSSSNAEGKVSYGVRLDTKAILDRWDTVFLHLHSTNIKEEA